MISKIQNDVINVINIPNAHPANPAGVDPDQEVDRNGMGQIQPNVVLAPYTSFRIGGPAEWYCEPSSSQELQSCLTWANAIDQPVTILGAGSNLLISDTGLPGLVINTRRLRGIHLEEDGRLWVAAGEPLAKLALIVAARGWSGLEWARGIPGTVGGAVFMNAGAHAAAMEDIFLEAVALDDQGELRTLQASDLNFSYRFSLLQHHPWVITGAWLQLEPGHDRQTVIDQTQRNWEQRRTTQPYHLPSCGSVFRNPKPYAAGWLIEQSGLKGFQIGGAQVSEQHANFILNTSKATAADIYELIRVIQTKVYQEWSLILHPEVRLLGDFGPDPLLRSTHA